jgi:sporulation protein YtfJ
MFQKNNRPAEEANENQNQAKTNKITDLIKESLGGVREFMEANTVTGTPISTPSGTIIIPISKVSMGFAAGGNDYANKDSAPNNNNFGGGGGTGVSINPIGFLVVDAEGHVDMININNPANDLGSSIENIMEKLPSILDKIKETLDGVKKSPSKAEAKTEPKPDESDNSEEVLAEILTETAKTAE